MATNSVTDPAVRPLPGVTARRRSSRAVLVRRFGLWGILVALVAVLSVVSPAFRDPFNLENILEQNSLLGIVACGMTVMMISGGFDLSVGAVGATASVVGAVVSNLGAGWLLTLLVGLASGIVVGLVNGLLIAKVNINAFVTTFAMASVVSGLLLVGTQSQSINGGTPELAWAATGAIGPIPVMFIIFLVCLAVVWILLTRTKLGHYIYSVGGNAEASRLSGVPVHRVQVIAFTIGGLFAAAAGVLLLGQTNVGQPSSAATWPLEAIAICVVGGVALTGGVGRIEDVLAATLILGVIANGLNQLNVSPYWQPVVTGVVIVVAVILDQYNRLRRRSAARADVSASTSPS